MLSNNQLINNIPIIASMAINIANIAPENNQGIAQRIDLGRSLCVSIRPDNKDIYGVGTIIAYDFSRNQVAFNSNYIPIAITYYEDPSPLGFYEYVHVPKRNISEVEIFITTTKKSSPTIYWE